MNSKNKLPDEYIELAQKLASNCAYSSEEIVYITLLEFATQVIISEMSYKQMLIEFLDRLDEQAKEYELKNSK